VRKWFFRPPNLNPRGAVARKVCAPMKIYTLAKSQIIHSSIEQCWAFFSNPANLVKITPSSLDFRVLSHVPARIYSGLMIQYRVRPLLGIPATWLTEITGVTEPHYFVDEQRVGPYKIWHHEHFFKQLDGSRVEIRDLIHYVMPFGFLGGIVHELIVKKDLERIFSYREKIVGEIFGAKLTAA
jgi:ligand-binding SRPBCC domain-containing protein